MGANRRDKGDGTIFQSKDGKWIAQIRIGKNANGKSNIKAFYGKSEAEVKKKLKAYKNELIKNDFQVVKKSTLEEYINNWLVLYKVPSMKPSSYDRLERTIKNHITPTLGSHQIGSIQSNDIQSLINNKTKEYSASTVKKIFDALNGCFNHAVDNDELIKNPMRTVVLPSKDNYAVKEKEIIILSDVEVKKFVTEAKRQHSTGKYAHPNGFALILMLNTGLRAGELLGLELNSIDLTSNTMLITQNLAVVKDRSENDKNYKVITQSVKTKSGNRVVPLNDTAKEMIQFLIDYHKPYRKNKDYLLVSKDGLPIRHRNIQKTLDAIIKKSDIKHCGLHTLRHTFASKLFENGIDVKTVSELLGHSSVKITYDIYIHVIQSQKVNAMDKLNTIFR